MHRYRSFRRPLPVLFLLALGCATNPVTGEKELALVSESQEIQMGREYDPQIVASLGLYPSEPLQKYVAELGLPMAAASERPHLPWSFRVVDDPVVNAFAVPGGFIYVTRGILAALNSEAELAGVLGHEIGHVTARHTVQQISRSQLMNLGVGLGSILSEDVGNYAGLILAGLQVLNLKYSRGNETQSDELGFRYMSKAGYDPHALIGVFETLALVSGDGGSRLPEWQLTHPYPENREANIKALIDASGGATGSRKEDRDAYVKRLDGMVYGANPREGFFKGQVFHHPDLAFRLVFPASWVGANEKEAVVGVSPDNDAVLVLSLSQEPSPQAAMSAFQGQQGVTSEPARQVTFQGLPGVRAGFAVQTQEGDLQGEIAYVSLDQRVFQLLGYSAQANWRRYAAPVRSSMETFQRETDRTVLQVEPARLVVVTLPRAMTFAEFLTAYPSSIPNSEVAVINRARPEDRLPAGRPMKRVVGKG